MTTATKEQTRKWTLDLGKVDVHGRGRETNRVTLDVELRHKANDVAPYLDVDLKECHEYTELSICGAIWNAAGTDHWSGGQNRETVAELFPDNPAVRRLCEIWDRWHLNGMKAGTRAQEEFLKANPITDRLDHYGKACAALKAAGLLEVPTGKKVINSNQQWVDATPYKYGSAWLVDPLPAEVEAELVALCGELSAKDPAQGVEPKNFAEEHGITATAVHVDSNPDMPDAAPDADHWKVTLRRGRARFTLYFTKGSGFKGAAPDAVELLGCLASESNGAGESFEEWCSNFGYETDSRKAKKTYDSCVKQRKKLIRFLGDGLFRALLEDTNG